jgi:glycosyltransferase involved in cell wall biosynthesis
LSGKEIWIVICDNDPVGGAAPTVRAWEAAKKSGMRVVYVQELQRGISFARNAAVAAALTDGAEAIVFVDDDEFVEPSWLGELLLAQSEYDAHVVAAPVKPFYEHGVPQWVIDAKFFHRPIPARGTQLSTAGTGNALVVREVFETVGWFDPFLGLTGGEDHDFFVRARLAGARMVFNDRAIVHEIVPPSRATLMWMLGRSYRAQGNYVYCERKFKPLIRWLPVRVMKTLAMTARGIVRVTAFPLLGRVTLFRGLQDLARASGAVAGAFTLLNDGYKTIHGS